MEDKLKKDIGIIRFYSEFTAWFLVSLVIIFVIRGLYE